MSSDPFFIDGPAVVSFSGGRTSGYMLWRILQAHGGSLPLDVVVCFANTGKEKEATLEFVRECSARWDISIVWVEFVSRAANGFTVVDFDCASRNGEPFDRLIETKQRLPNVVERACTEELKIKTMNRYLATIGFDDPMHVVGVRADEPRRIPRLRNNGRALPLVDAAIRKSDVHAFWRGAAFDLGLPYEDGHGNCDLCFQKTFGQVMARIAEDPPRAVWWAAKEDRIGARFHKDRPSYQAMANFIRDQRTFEFDPNEEAVSCFCGD